MNNLQSNQNMLYPPSYASNTDFPQINLVPEKINCNTCYREHKTNLCHICGTQVLLDPNIENIIDCKRYQNEYVQVWQVKEYIENLKKELDELRIENYHLQYQPGGEGAKEAQKHFEEMSLSNDNKK